MKKIFYILLIASSGLTATGNALACVSSYDLYTCSGATFDGAYTVHVEFDSPWESADFQGEDDESAGCKGNKDEGFSCTKKGNLISSRIDDAIVMAAYASSTDHADLGLTGTGEPTYAVVHARVFDPGSCATSFSCDFVNGGGGSDTCYDSGYPDGPGFDGNFDNADDSCENTAANAGEGMFAEGTPFSEDRPKPGKTKHKNWAMYVELDASELCEAGILAVEHATTLVCASAEITTTAVADGGDWPDTFIDAGAVTFTPDADCEATFHCESTTTSTDDCISE